MKNKGVGSGQDASFNKIIREDFFKEVIFKNTSLFFFFLAEPSFC